MRICRSDRGFTLIELMVVVLIIGVLVLIAVPILSGASDQARVKACYSNQRLVEGAYSSHVASAGVDPAIVDWATLINVLVPDELHSVPTCPSGGVYTWTPNDVSCSIHGTYH